MIVVGVDPGLVATGYGVIQASGTASKIIEAGVVRTEKADPLERRVLRIYNEISDVIAEFKPAALAVEELYSHYEHPMTATLMGHARGVMFLAAAEKDVPVFSYAATRIKKALTGSGSAGKAQVQRMVQKLLGVSTPIQPDHVTDALAAALCHANMFHRGKMLGSFPAGTGG